MPLLPSPTRKPNKKRKSLSHHAFETRALNLLVPRRKRCTFFYFKFVIPFKEAAWEPWLRSLVLASGSTPKKDLASSPQMMAAQKCLYINLLSIAMDTEAWPKVIKCENRLTSLVNELFCYFSHGLCFLLYIILKNLSILRPSIL